VLVRFHPEDLSRIFVSVPGKEFIEVRFADLRRPPISLWEQRSVVRYLRDQGQKLISEAMMFRAIEEQRRLVTQAQRNTHSTKHRASRTNHRPARGTHHPGSTIYEPTAVSDSQLEPVDYSKPAPAYDAEQW